MADLSEAYFLDNHPAVLNFSGGRSSAYMLYHILDYYDGKLPDDTIVAFCNTGKENPETLDFVRECQNRWNVDIVWLEYLFRPESAGGIKDPKHHFMVVDYASASRQGEPFDQLVAAKSFLPNVVRRFCTSELKVLTVSRYTRRVLGWKKHTAYLGMRYDEPRRVKRQLMESCESDYPLYHAQVTKRDIDRFWRNHEFDLQLKDLNGNCDLCFMKGQTKLIQIMRKNPEKADWWLAKEQELVRCAEGRLNDMRVAQFSKRFSYQELFNISQSGGDQIPLFEDEEILDCFCSD